jgi:hypothetical protein
METNNSHLNTLKKKQSIRLSMETLFTTLVESMYTVIVGTRYVATLDTAKRFA